MGGPNNLNSTHEKKGGKHEKGNVIGLVYTFSIWKKVNLNETNMYTNKYKRIGLKMK